MCVCVRDFGLKCDLGVSVELQAILLPVVIVVKTVLVLISTVACCINSTDSTINSRGGAVQVV